MEERIVVEYFVPLLIDGRETRYSVSTIGRIKNDETGKFLKPILSGKYYIVNLRLDKYEQITRLIHRLVAETFIPNPEHKRTVNHKQGNAKGKLMNTVDNLEWATYEEQSFHAYKNGLKGMGDNNSLSTHTEKEAREVCELIQSGYNDAYIITRGFDQSFVRKIRNKISWKNISAEYDFPYERPIFSNRGYLSADDKDKIYDIFMDNPNYSIKEVIKLMKLPVNKNIRRVTKDLKYRVMELSKVQRLSKTEPEMGNK